MTRTIQPLHRIFKQLIFIALAILLRNDGTKVAEARQQPRNINIINRSGHTVSIHWIRPENGSLVEQNAGLLNGATFALNSFVSHKFQVAELPHKKKGVCESGEQDVCKIGYFTVENTDEQVFFIDTDLSVQVENTKTKATEKSNELISDCEANARSKLKHPKVNVDYIITEMAKCVQESVANQMILSNEEISFQAQTRRKLGEHFEEYTCKDPDVNATEPVETKYWNHNGNKLKVDIMLNRPASKVHVIHNFITEEECDAMEEAASSRLHKATVADGKGGSEYSPSRKAMQAGIKIPWHLEYEKNPLTTVSRKVYDYVNFVLNLDIKENGQEDLMSIQYTGRGEDDEEPDRYTPHCDGDCSGLDFKPGNRMATIVMYCTIPEKGGATNFRNSGIHVKPKKGSATFFSYIDPNTMKMDNGFTEHSGCPVVLGEKKIVTQWVRLGVDDENPWDSFNTLGIKKSEEE